LFKSAAAEAEAVAVLRLLRLSDALLSPPLYKQIAQFVLTISCAVFWPATTTFVFSASVRSSQAA
jgi:hypothetical protein